MPIKNPPFEITEKILTLTAQISELIGTVSATGKEKPSVALRRSNRIKSVYSSCAIEQNTLSLEQVTALICGKRVLAPLKDITEIKNAFELYEHLSKLNPFSVDDLLFAHSVMTKDTVSESGCFRSKAVGVADKDGNILHLGTLPAYVPQSVDNLLKWVQTSSLDMLIKSCIFHYEFELIHPFSDGNGRMGRLWHTLLLSKRNRLFEWLPIESIVHDNQDKYYQAINRSNAEGNSTVFVEFMLETIKTALEQAVSTFDTKPSAEDRASQIVKYLKSHEYIMNADVRSMFGVSIATASRILKTLTEKQVLIKIRIGSFWGYKLKK
ncbi:MAG: Fic family protein [Oscillospiraceae bacterium]|nr:Fic family protein [Candidatus Equicaccousia limihippi]